MSLQYIVSNKRNMAVCNDLREVFGFLKELKARGITYATIFGSEQNVRLSENGHWIWTDQPESKATPKSAEIRKTCG
jgi:hypothetical protein